MRRKVIKQGHNTLTVTLPSDWVARNSVSAGDDIELEESSKHIKIYKVGQSVQSPVTINLDRFETLGARAIYALYKRGEDEIRVEYANPASSSHVQKAIRDETLGYEIIRQSSEFCHIKCISDPVVSEFESILRRAFLLLNAMSEDCYEAIRTKDYESLRTVRFMELTNNRHMTVCRRIINKFGIPDYPNPNFIYYILEELERLADHYKYICDYFLELEKPIGISAKTLELFQQANEMVKDVYTLFYSFKPEAAEAMAIKRKALVKKTKSLFESADRRELMLIHNLSIIYQKVFCMLGPILAMRI